MATQSKLHIRPARGVLFCLIPVVLLLVTDLAQWHLHPILPAVDLPDPDTVMRVAWLKEVNARGSWMQGFFSRDNAPYGMILHWTRPFNVIVLGVVGLMGLLGANDPWYEAAVFTGPLVRVGIAFGSYWVARGLLTPPIACAAAVALVFSPYIANYGMFGTANHHVWIYGLALAMLGCWFRLVRDPEGDHMAVLTGLLGGLCLWTSFELLPVIALQFGYLAWRWIEEGHPWDRPLTLCCCSFALLITLAWLVDPTYGGYFTVAFDHVSLAYVTLAWLSVLVCAVITMGHAGTWSRRAAVATAAGAAAAIAWGVCFPAFRYGVLGKQNAAGVGVLSLPVENLPLATPEEFLFLLGPGLAAIVLCIACRRTMPRAWMILPVLIVAALVGYRYYRLVMYLFVPSVFVLAWWFDRREQLGGTARATARMLLACLAGFLVLAHLELASLPKKPFPGTRVAGCSPDSVRLLLNDPQWLDARDLHPIFVNDLPVTPFLLFTTPVRTVAGSYHRDVQGLSDLFAFTQSGSDAPAHRIAQQRGVEFILLCETTPYAAFQHFSSDKGMQPDRPAEDTFYNRLAPRNHPAWLKIRPWPEGTKTGLLLYQVQPGEPGDIP